MPVEFTIAYICGRAEPQLEWALDSLRRQITDERVHVLVVDFYGRTFSTIHPSDGLASFRSVEPKPTPWQGRHRITDRDWWAKSSASNTALALCRTAWISFLDDRLVLGDGWLAGVCRAIKGQYVTLGRYEKRVGMLVDQGRIVDAGQVVGVDHRYRTALLGGPKNTTIPGHGSWLFGANFGLPLSWALAVNGFEEGVDGLSSEDSLFGRMLENRGHSFVYDVDMAVIEDRTIAEATTPLHRRDFYRTDKGTSPRDKSHAALARFGIRQRTDPELTPDLTAIRAAICAGNAAPWPMPDPNLRDWYDGQLVREMIPPA
jgi:hypothetical protein